MAEDPAGQAAGTGGRDEPPAFRLLPDSDEVELGPDDQLPEPPAGFSRGAKLAAISVLAALLASGIGLQVHRSRQAADKARIAATARRNQPAPVLGAAGVPWPSASVGVCGGPGALLPITTTKPLTEHTGIQLTVGSNGLRQVSLDEGKVSTQPQFALREGSLVIDRRTVGTTSYLVVDSCGGGLRVLKSAPGKLAVNIGSDIAAAALFGDRAAGVWAASFTPGTTLAEAQLQVSMLRLDRPSEFLLPANTFPVALTSTVAVGQRVSASSQTPQQLIVYDIRRHRISRNLGPMTSVTYSRGLVIWNSQPCSAATACPIHSYDPVTGVSTVRGYSLPVESGVTGAVLSPDRHRLAFQLPRMADDPHYVTRLPGQPSDLVVLDLRSGVSEPIPNLEVPPNSLVGMTFDPTSRWLVVGVTTADGPQLLVWRSGLNNPLVGSARLPGPVPDPIPLLPIDPTVPAH